MRFTQNCPERMKHTTWNLFILLGILLSSVVTLGNDVDPAIQTTGFFDLHFHQNKEPGHQYKTHMGQAEYGIGIQWSPTFSAEAAIAYAGGSPLLEMGSGVIKWQWRQEKSHSSERVTVALGQFDVPFGIDYRQIAAPDRYFMEPSLVSLNMMNWFNSIGVKVQGQAGRLRPTLYVIRGMTKKPAVGGRIGILPSRSVVLGVSFHTEFVNTTVTKPVLAGADFQYHNSIGTVTTEWIAARCIFAAEQVKNSAMHGGMRVTFESAMTKKQQIPVAFMLRGSRWNAMEGRKDLPALEMTEFTGGIRVRVTKHLLLSTDITYQNSRGLYPSIQLLGTF